MSLETENNFELDREAQGVSEVEITSLIDDLGELEKLDLSLNPEQKNILEQISNRVKVFANRVARISLLASLGFALNYEMTHQKIEITKDTAGIESYSHPDGETMHILNYIAGKDYYSVEDKLANARSGIVALAKYEKIEVPKNFYQMNYSETKVWFMKSFAESFKDSDGSVADYFFSYMLLAVDKKFEFDEEIYNSLWKMEIEAGSPRIRWNTESGPIGKVLNQAHYSPLDNTIYIEPKEAFGDTFAELAHAKQFNDAQISSYIRSIKRFLVVGGKALSFSAPVMEKYQEEYDKPGTIEYEAHRIIEPYLEYKYGRRKPHSKI